MEPASPSKPEKQSKGGLVFALGLLVGIAIASVVGWWSWNRTLPTDSPTVINIGDGSGMMGREILAAAALLSNERVVRIEFSENGLDAGAVETLPRKVVAEMPCDWAYIRVTPVNAVMNDEVLSLDEVEDRFLVSSESARLTDTRASIILDCDRPVTGRELVRVLSIMEKTKVDQIIVFVPHELRATPPPPSPQIKALAHPVELK